MICPIFEEPSDIGRVFQLLHTKLVEYVSFVAVAGIYQGQRHTARSMPKLRSWFKLRRTFGSRPIHPSIVQIRMNHPNHPKIILLALKAYPKSPLRGEFGAVL